MQSHSLFQQHQMQLCLFACPSSLSSPASIRILEQPTKKVKLSEEAHLNSLMNSMQLAPKQELFLTKLDPTAHSQVTREISCLLARAHQNSSKDRKERRREMMDSARQKGQEQASEEVMSRRKIRIVQLGSMVGRGEVRGVVELGGKTYNYEDLSMAEEQEYYVLQRREGMESGQTPSLELHQSLISPVDFQENEVDEDYNDSDSNHSDNPNYDYPDEEDSRSSGDIIRRDYDDEDYGQERPDSNSEDEEELYRQYLRRCRKKEQEMDFEPNYEEYD